jgi:large subunit ribosomal protein L24
MKKDYIKSWISSKQPRKQRKYRHNAPLHVQNNFLNSNLSKDLRKKHDCRSLRVRKGDKVKVMRGQHKGKTGKVDRVSVNFIKVYVTGIDIIRKDGTKSLIALEPSKLQIIELDSSDKRRLLKDNVSEGKNGKKSP